MTHWKDMLVPFVMIASAIAFGAKAAPPQFDHAISNIPGKSLVAVEVTMAPGQRGMPHHHAKSAFISAYVISGAVRSQVDDGPVKTFKAGEHFTENPGAHHVVSENASDTEPAKVLAIFVVDSSETPLTMMDK